MVARELRLLPHVWLHPVHHVKPGSSNGAFSDEGAPSPRSSLKPLRPASSHRECRKKQLENLLQDVISKEMGTVHGQATPETPRCRVLLSSTCVVVDSGDGESLRVSLLFTDVFESVLPRNQGTGYVIALAPRPGPAGSVQQATQGPLQSHLGPGFKPLTPPLQDVWVFMVACNSLDLKKLLFDLGGRGALRWDLGECYTIARKPLGEGGYGKVFLGQSIIAKEFKKSLLTSEEVGRDVVHADQVAVKVFKQQMTQKEENLMRMEIDFLSRLRGHPNITSLYGVFCDFDRSNEMQGSQIDGTSWLIVMELCSSGDLFDHLSGGTLDTKTCDALMKGLSAALDHLHMLRVVHRDVKPENILMGARSQPLLADMGIAANLDDALEMAKVCGSPGYAAPEVVSNKRYNELVDIFSAGCVYYYALSGHHPFQGADEYDTLVRTTKCKESYPQRWFRHVSSSIVNLTKFCLSKDPRKRPSARQCMEALAMPANEGSMQHHGAKSPSLATMASNRVRNRPGGAESSSSEERSSSYAMDALGATGVESSAAMPADGAEAGPEASSVPSSSMVLPSVPEAASMARPEAALPSSSPNVLPSTPDEPASPARQNRHLSTQTSGHREPRELFVMPTPPAQPKEQQKTARRPRSIPSRIQHSLRSMPSDASHWLAGAFRKALKPRSSASSSGALEPTPQPPSSASSSKKNFRSSFLWRQSQGGT